MCFCIFLPIWNPPNTIIDIEEQMSYVIPSMTGLRTV